MTRDKQLSFLRETRKPHIVLVDFLEDADQGAGVEVHDGRVSTCAGSEWIVLDRSPAPGLHVKSKFRTTKDRIEFQWRSHGDTPSGTIWLKVFCDLSEVAPRYLELGPATDSLQEGHILAEYLKFDLQHSKVLVDILFDKLDE